MNLEELLITLKMLDIKYDNQGSNVYINSNYLYADEELEFALKKLLINNGYKYRYSQWDIDSTEWFCIFKNR
jgi:hypothetical protein